MSWREAARRAAVLAATLPLAGCLTPLYGGGSTVVADMQAIAVDPVPDRLGHTLRDELISDLNGTGASPRPRFRLALDAHERVQTALVDIVTRRASNATVVVDIDYVLTPAAGGPPVTAGTVTSAASYNRSEQRFANIRAAKDAEIRDAKVVADEITQRIAAALATRH